MAIRSGHVHVFAELVAAVTISLAICHVNGHGRLIEPPSRSTMWRYGFNSTPNYNDHELYCGGLSHQWNRNGGKCGICGDAWDLPKPRPNEAGGKYGQGVIVRNYRPSSSIRIKVELTANHRGYFEFRICPNNNPKKAATQSCLNKYQLQQADGSGARYHPGTGNRVFDVKYKLPTGLTCTQCVFQWIYKAGNNWGICANGTEGMGCGRQEEFRACADISIITKEGEADETESQDIDNDDELPVRVPTIDPTLNEIDDVQSYDKSSRTDGSDAKESSSDFFIGFIVVTVALGVTVLILAAVLFFSPNGRDALKQFLGRLTNGKTCKLVTINVCSNQTSSGDSCHSDITKDPVAPPRFRKQPLTPPETLCGSRLTAASISPPTNVSINGINLVGKPGVANSEQDEHMTTIRRLSGLPFTYLPPKPTV